MADNLYQDFYDTQVQQQLEQRRKEERKAARRKVVASIVVTMAIVLLCLWGASAVSPQLVESLGSPSSGSSDPAVVQQPGFADNGANGNAPVATRQLTDSQGRTVEVPESPRHIAVMDSFCGELCIMIGAGPQLIGLPAGAMSDQILQTIYPELGTNLLALSGNAVNIETLLQMNCDLALVKDTMPAGELNKLTRMGIPYLVVGYGTFEEQMEAALLVGEACGGQAQENAQRLVAFYRDTAALVQQRVADVPADAMPTVYHSINQPLTTDGAGSLGADWISLCACVDVSAGQAPTAGTDYDATLEQIYVWNPSYIICNVAATADAIRGDSKWQALTAVQQGAVANIPIGATRWGQRGSVETALAMLWLGKLAHPQLFEDVDLQAYVTDYYRDYLGVTVDEALYQKIIAGEGIRTGGGDGSGGGTGQGGGK